MGLKPLEQFICDYCGEVIEAPEHGWLEWLVDIDAGFAASDFYVVHHAMYSPRKPQHCYHHQHDARRHDLYLTQFLDGKGMARLLKFLDAGPYHEPDYNGPRVADMREFVELMRRLTIPYYEEARLYWDRAERDGFFAGANEIWLYLPDNLETLIERYGDKSE